MVRFLLWLVILTPPTAASGGLGGSGDVVDGDLGDRDDCDLRVHLEQVLHLGWRLDVTFGPGVLGDFINSTGWFWSLDDDGHVFFLPYCGGWGGDYVAHDECHELGPREAGAGV